tara:strand:+ start:265 stop:420 length:156 start_codon:yes stop_codon:yes gene_type:complete
MSNITSISFDTHQALMEYLIQTEPDQYSVYKHEDVKDGVRWLFNTPCPLED